MILDSGENCVRSVVWAFSCVFFAVVGPILHERCLSQVVPLCLVPEIALPRACRADDFGWFGHGCSFHSCVCERLGSVVRQAFVQTLSVKATVARI